MVAIEDFWKIDDFIKNKWGKHSYKFVDYCGLEPVRPMKCLGYFCTPKNSKTFASTGGDGVHFGLVNGQNNKGNLGPIVMTVPMAEDNNVIVAENLEEFFSLGYYVGWFALEQIVYNLDETIEYYSKPDEETSQKEHQFLELIKKEMPIQHLTLSKDRLVMLKKEYFNCLEIGNLGD
ncbi:MAG: hypothetical protein AAGI07_06220 [Bacteroidota bacterium]